VFGLAQLLGIEYRPELADMPDQRSWRIDPGADYGPLNSAARGRIDLDRVRRHWEDILRVIASIYTGTVRAYDVVRMLQRDGNPTPLGEAIASYGRIFKSLHILTYIDDDTYRRDIKGVRNLQEGRHSLAGHVFHGKKGQLYQRYHKGMEDQLGALGLVLNCIVLWNTRYMNAALASSAPRAAKSGTRMSRGSPRSFATTSTSTGNTRSCCRRYPPDCERYETPKTMTEPTRSGIMYVITVYYHVHEHHGG
jgi:TnpA family transposase